MGELLRFLHSWARWGLVIVAVVLVVWLLLGWLQQRPYPKRLNTLMAAFSGLVDLNWLIGIIFLLGIFGMSPIRYHWEHAFMMTLALIIGHVPMAWRKKDIPASRRYRNNLLVVVAVLAAVFIGISVLAQPVQWRFYVPL
ncbi:MAG: hypothetical protein MUE40_07025 [Anaerolineae bacterium]|jgi:multisubunit Na+/H+ antiporter MnhB subunit|nr:hypothetical protein [Anaerolineae bacterium]